MFLPFRTVLFTNRKVLIQSKVFLWVPLFSGPHYSNNNKNNANERTVDSNNLHGEITSVVFEAYSIASAIDEKPVEALVGNILI